MRFWNLNISVEFSSVYKISDQFSGFQWVCEVSSEYMDIASFMGKFLVAITMVTGASSLIYIEIMEGLEVHYSVNKEMMTAK